MSKGRRNKQNKRRREKCERRDCAVTQPPFVREGTHVQDVKKTSRLWEGLKAVGGFLNRMFFRARLLVAFPFLMVGMVLVVPKDSLEFFGEAWDMFKRGGV